MRVKKLTLLAVLLILVVIVPLAIRGFRGSTTGLHAVVVVRKADIGIPGVSKMSAARLLNLSLWPIRVSRCNFTDDAFSHGRMVAYAVQRWDGRGKRWTTVVEPTASGFCKPYPLGIVEGKVTSELLWPGHSVSTGEEATAARDAFNVGDQGRFVVFAGTPGDYSRSVVTREFLVDEHSQAQAPPRISH